MLDKLLQWYEFCTDEVNSQKYLHGVTLGYLCISAFLPVANVEGEAGLPLVPSLQQVNIKLQY